MNLQKPNAFLLYKTCVFDLKPYIFFLYSHQKDAHTAHICFKNDFILVLCNKINEFLTQAKFPVWYLLCDILLVCIFLQSLEEGSGNQSYFYHKIVLQLASIHGNFFLYIAFIHSEENNQEI